MGADDPNSVPMMRIEEPERVFDREKVLGRDAASVFPTMAQENADKVVSATQAVVDVKKAVVKKGGLYFVFSCS